VIVPPTLTVFTLSDIHTDVEYSFHVSASTVIGEGETTVPVLVLPADNGEYKKSRISSGMDLVHWHLSNNSANQHAVTCRNSAVKKK
jgi:hypothetical protein